jgi:hypothetical protein
VPPGFGGPRVGFAPADEPDHLGYERGGNSDERNHGPVSSAGLAVGAGTIRRCASWYRLPFLSVNWLTQWPVFLVLAGGPSTRSTARPGKPSMAGRAPRLCSVCLFTMRYKRLGAHVNQAGAEPAVGFPACAIADAVQHHPGSSVSRTGGRPVLLVKTAEHSRVPRNGERSITRVHQSRRRWPGDTVRRPVRTAGSRGISPDGTIRRLSRWCWW